MLVEELRAAIECIGRITGHIDVEDILDVLFKEFCIGKWINKFQAAQFMLT